MGFDGVFTGYVDDAPGRRAHHALPTHARPQKCAPTLDFFTSFDAYRVRILMLDILHLLFLWPAPMPFIASRPRNGISRRGLFQALIYRVTAHGDWLIA